MKMATTTRSALPFSCLPVLLAFVLIGAAALAMPPSALGAPAEEDGPAIEAVELNVREVIVLALRNNRALENARLSRSIARMSLDLAEAEFRPRFTFGADSQRSETPTSAAETMGVRSAIALRIPTGGDLSVSSSVTDRGDVAALLGSHSNIVTLTFSQPLLRGAGFGTALANLRTARVNEEINVLSFEQTVTALMSSALNSFRSYVQAGRRAEIAARSLERSQQLLQVNRLLVQAGRLAERDIVQAEADIARRELDIISARGGLDTARLSLIDVLDLETGTRFEVAENFSVGQPAPLSLDIATAMEMALANRPDHQIGLLGLRNAQTQLAVARNSRLWDLSLSLSRNFSASDNGFIGTFGGLDRTGTRIGLNLNVPIGQDADRLRLSLRSAETSLRVAENGLKDLRQRIEIEVRNAVRNLTLAARRVELARRARELSEEKAEIEREKLNLGVTTNFQLVTFENDLVLAQNAEIDAVFNHLNAATELDRTLGTTLDRWGIDIGRVEHSTEASERYGMDAGGAPR